jgi:hypothetical protein
MLHESQYGRDGMKPERSAISGRALAPEDVYTSVNGYKIGVKAVEWRNMSRAEKDALRAEWEANLPAGAGRASSAEPDAPDYDALSMDELKALASERGVEISGRRSKDDIRQALRVADVTARFAPAPDSADGKPLDLSATVGE